MPCLIVLTAWLSPRLAIFFLWLFTDRMEISMDSGWMGLAGFFLLPWTTLMYALSYQLGSGVSGLGWFFVALGFGFDMVSWFGGGSQAKQRQATSA